MKASDKIDNQDSSEYVDKLISEMTLEEKVSQMLFEAPGIERLGIAPYNWWNECLHGLGRAGVATVFPQSIGLAAMWNPDLLGQIAAAISDEARAKHHEAKRLGMHNIYAGLTFWSPTINIFRDPRWGRGQETYGEDPYLTATMAVAFIRNLQGEDPDALKLVATAKHYAVHSGPESSRHYFDAQVEEWLLREFYLFAFEACVKEARVESIMGAYNRVNSEPCCASSTLLTRILREEWQFSGYVVSDCEAIWDIFENHRVADSAAEAAAMAVLNGCDLNCGTVFQALLEAHHQGLISEEAIDNSVKRLMTARYRLGMFQPDGGTPFSQIPIDIVNSPSHQKLALEAARESMVLLKNDGEILPLSKDIGSIAVVGPNAAEVLPLLGNYNGTPLTAITPLEGIQSKLSPNTKITYSRGCEMTRGIAPLSPIPSEYLRPSGNGQNEMGLAASYFDNPELDGQPALTRIDREIDFIWKDTSPISGKWGDQFSAIWEGTIIPPSSGIYRIGLNACTDYKVELNGETALTSSHIHHPMLRTADVEFITGEEVHIRIEYANRGLDPQIQLLWSPVESDYKIQALEAAEQADLVIAVMGLSNALEGEEMPVEVEGFSGGDRTDIGLPHTQLELLKEIQALGKPLVLVLLNGSALGIGWAEQNVPAILEAWYPGQAGGEAIADVLFGDFNPGGKLPVTFYESAADLPSFEDYTMANRGYRYFSGRPLYPFGFGLSYTTFDYTGFEVDRTHAAVGSDVNISVDVKNTGSRLGDAVVQLYVRQPESDTPRPSKVLIGFKRLTLEPEQKKKITFTVNTNQLAFYNRAGELTLPPGSYRLMLGDSSDHLPHQAAVKIMDNKISSKAEKVFFSAASIE